MAKFAFQQPARYRRRRCILHLSREYKWTVGSCPQVLHVSFSCFLHVLLSIRP